MSWSSKRAGSMNSSPWVFRSFNTPRWNVQITRTTEKRKENWNVHASGRPKMRNSDPRKLVRGIMIKSVSWGENLSRPKPPAPFDSRATNTLHSLTKEKKIQVTADKSMKTCLRGRFWARYRDKRGRFRLKSGWVRWRPSSCVEVGTVVALGDVPSSDACRHEALRAVMAFVPGELEIKNINVKYWFDFEQNLDYGRKDRQRWTMSTKICNKTWTMDKKITNIFVCPFCNYRQVV